MKSPYFTIHPGKNPPPQNGCWLKSVFVFLKAPVSHPPLSQFNQTFHKTNRPPLHQILVLPGHCFSYKVCSEDSANVSLVVHVLAPHDNALGQQEASQLVDNLIVYIPPFPFLGLFLSKRKGQGNFS
jgi:hypothetical protein